MTLADIGVVASGCRYVLGNLGLNQWVEGSSPSGLTTTQSASRTRTVWMRLRIRAQVGRNVRNWDGCS